MAVLFHEVWIAAPTVRVYDAISTADGISTWWDKQTVTQTPQGMVFEHNPGPEHGVVRMKVLQPVHETRVEWECISQHPKTSPASAWTGTHIIFEITTRSVPLWAAKPVNMTILKFRHAGWDENSEYLGFCNFAWAQALTKLKQVCEAGIGSAP